MSQTTKVQAFNPEDVVHRHLNMVYNLFDAASRRINQEVLKETHAFHSEDDKGYVCIHLNPEAFVRVFAKLIEGGYIQRELPLDELSKTTRHRGTYRSPRFLDVGCGVGHKVYTAESMFGFDAYGIDLRDVYFKHQDEVINRMLQWYSANSLKQADAFKYDGYKNFDIIYFYCPIADTATEIALEKHIVEQAKPGTIIVGFLSKYINYKAHAYDFKKGEVIKLSKLTNVEYLPIEDGTGCVAVRKL